MVIPTAALKSEVFVRCLFFVLSSSAIVLRIDINLGRQDRFGTVPAGKSDFMMKVLFSSHALRTIPAYPYDHSPQYVIVPWVFTFEMKARNLSLSAV